MKLKEVLKKIEIVKTNLSVDSNPNIEGICFDSRECGAGDLFVAQRGVSYDGHDYIATAIERGASVVVCENIPDGGINGNYAIVKDTHHALGQIAANFYNNPSEHLKVLGITGTNGKTTTVTLLYKLFRGLGYKCGLLSTISNFIEDRELSATHTTPDPVQINRLMAEMVYEGCEYCFMEVSSHALDQQRIAGIQYYGAIFSNISHDHLDYHNTFLEYIKAKKSFFDSLSPHSFALTNIDDPNGMVMLQNTKAKKVSYSCQSPADYNCRIVEKTMEGMLLNIDGSEFWTSLIGKHNAYNLLSVYSAARLLGASKDEALVEMSKLENVPGRLEYVKGGNDITAIVDYAHTPDALENVLKTLREFSHSRQIITLFGCGGNRDKTKRPEMAEVSAKYSDKVVVTSDNPRFEEPEAIIDDIRKGFSIKDMEKTLFITDRREAIKVALMIVDKGGIVLVAGKGHENYQDIKGVKHHFNDKEEIQKIFNQTI